MKLSLARHAAVTAAFAAVTAAAALTFLWPRSTFADGDLADTLDELEVDGAQVDDVVATGEIVRDPKSKSGWSVEITAKNPTARPAEVALETELMKTVSNPMSRVGMMPSMVWKTSESMSLAPGESIVKRYAVPKSLASELANAAAFQARVDAAVQKGDELPSIAMRPHATFRVVFRHA